jgi:RNA polymerase sigma-70 factor (ECF subfamily)
VQAAIAAVHADAPTAADTDWGQIVALYDLLLTMRPDAVVALNRATAIGERDGPGAGLAALAAVGPDRLDAYQPYHAAHADLLARAGRRAEAVAAYDRALALTTNATERRFLDARRAAL